MDFLSILGVIVAFTAILGGNYLEGGHINSLFNGPAALIVIGGTVAAIMLQTPFNMLKRGFVMLRWVFIPPYVSLDDRRWAFWGNLEWPFHSHRTGMIRHRIPK